MIVLVGASASGKTEVCKDLINRYGFKKFVTTTTRQMRVGETNNIDYHFISVCEFNSKVNNNDFIEYVSYSGNFYGSTYDEVGDNKVVILEPNGVNSFYSKLKDKVVIFYLDCDEDVRVDRMRKRKDKEEDIKRRIENDRISFKTNLLKHIDLVINSNNLSIEEISDVIYKSYNSR